MLVCVCVGSCFSWWNSALVMITCSCFIQAKALILGEKNVEEGNSGTSCHNIPSAVLMLKGGGGDCSTPTSLW